MRYVIEKDGERQNVTNLVGHEDWLIVSEVDDSIPDLDAELVDGQWVIPIEILRARKWTSIKEARDNARLAGHLTAFGTFDVDAESQRKIAGAVTMAILVGPAFTIDWTLFDNSVVTLSETDMKQVGVAIGQFEAGIHATGQALRAAIDVAISQEELDALQW